MVFCPGVIPAVCVRRVRAEREERQESHVTVLQDVAGLFVTSQQHQTPVRTTGEEDTLKAEQK